MKLLGRTAHPAPGPELDTHLHAIFDDRRTPGAPESLYRFLGGLPMESSPVSGRGRFTISFGGLGHVGRLVATLALVAVLGAGVLAVPVGLPRDTVTGGGANWSPGAVPTQPAAPKGWHFESSFGSPGTDGIWVGHNVLTPAPRIAIHVVCDGPDLVVVLASTQSGTAWLPGGVAQAVTFDCAPGGHESRVELVAPAGDFQEIAATVIRNPSSTADTTFVVSIEVPDETPRSAAPPSAGSAATPSK